MAISEELNRIIQAKAGIKSALQEKFGLTISDSSKIDEYPALIQEMEVGGGVDTSLLIDVIEREITDFDIPAGTTKIGHFAFSSCSKLMEISIPNTVQMIAANAFNYCGLLNHLIIPSSVNAIGPKVFYQNTNLNDMVILKDTPPTLDSENEFNNSLKIYVKNAAINSYKNAGGNWNDVSTRITPLAAIDYDASTYTVTASGRDNVELYVDASLCDSSVYTFVPDTIDVSHNITVKSVDPSLGILDTVSQEILIEGETQELKNYMALTAVQNSSVGFEINNNVDLKYSSDGVNWSNMTSGNAGKLNLPAGETLYFKGNNPSTPQGLGYFQLTGQVDASGNAMSLIYDDNFENQLTAPNYAFQSLFLSCTALNSVEDLLLPATTLGEGCYRSLFYGCTNITKAPVLPATTLVRYCYASMFSGCSSLNYIKAMFTSEPSDSALSGWTSNVANTGTFVMNAAAEWNPEEYDLEIGDLVWDWTIEKVNA